MSKLKNFLKNIKSKAKPLGNNAAKNAQYRHLVVAAIVVAGIATFATLIQHHHDSSSLNQEQNQSISKNAAMVNFTDPTNHVNQQSVWIQRSENSLAAQRSLEQRLEAKQKSAGLQIVQQDNVVKQQQKEIQLLKGQLNNIQNTLLKQQKQKEERENLLQKRRASVGRIVAPIGQHHKHLVNYYNGPQMVDHHIRLTHRRKKYKKREKTPKTWVSPGAFVTAVVLQGVDASAGVTSQSDPRPVLLRTLSNGTLPGDYHSHLKNCFIIGSGYGDVSSERVYVRLETMSCIRHGVETDFPVYGYISGTDALTGQRGPVVFRDGPFVARAFAGGVLAGIGNLGQQYAQNQSTSPLGTVSTLDPSKIPEAALGAGFGMAGQMYAQYNIKRAEQYQPVVEFGAGNVINVVFTKGFWLDGHNPHPHQYAQTKNNISNSHQQNQNFASQLNQLSQAQRSQS